MKLANRGKKRSSLLWIIKSTAAQRKNIFVLIITYALFAFSGVYTALVSKNIIDSAVNKDKDKLILFGIIFGVVILIQAALRIINRLLSFNIEEKLRIYISNRLFSTIVCKDYSATSKYHSGEHMNRLTNDVDIIVAAVINILPNVTYVVVKLVGVFVILCTIDYRFALILSVVGLAAFLLSTVFKSKMKSLHKAVQEAVGKIRSFMQEILGSVLVIKAFNAEKKVTANLYTLCSKAFKTKSKRMKISTVTTTLFSLGFAVCYLYGIIWGGLGILEGTLTYGTLTAILALISQIQAPISGLSSVLPQYYSAIASAERIMEMENLPDEKTINLGRVKIEKLYEAIRSIEFENITFTYDRDTVLENANLSLKKGDFAIITGISGIGKSTLLKLLMGVYDTEDGEIYLRLDNGEKIYIDKNVRSLFAYVPQGNFLLSGTLRENICFANSKATDKEIRRAIELSCSDDFIDDLPKGINTVIGENGRGLSEGQVQRIAIARAILGEAPILLLDEATSALDEATELRLLQNLKSLNNKTCILITHKKAAEMICDTEIIISKKKVLTNTL